MPGGPGKEVYIQSDPGPAIEIRLGAPDGRCAGKLMFQQDSCRVERITGRHDLFLVFPNENIQAFDWFRFR